MLRILALEPYYGGSHRAFLDGWREHSRHRVELLTMPARKWKWRMRGAALTMSETLRDRGLDCDLMLVSDFLDLAALRSLLPAEWSAVPAVAYFHENQITYPLPPEDERDYQFGFTNLTTCLAAEKVLFNSGYHRRAFLEGAARLLEKMPDFVPEWAPERIRERSEVVPVGVDLASIDARRPQAEPRTGPLTVLWNHRWEYDKGGEEFFDVILELHREGLPFELTVLGRSFRSAPPVFERALAQLEERLRVGGYLESRADYCRALLESDVVVSTALEEFFGISVVEAVYAGCLPLLPERLSYPEILPSEYHRSCLYDGRADLKERLSYWINHPEEARRMDLRSHVRRFGWDRVAPRLDAVAMDVREGGLR